MSYEWAENEIRLACKKENPNYVLGGDNFDYGCACYESALKLYKIIMDNTTEHSGSSFNLTLDILNRLTKKLPLTPIEDIESDWVYIIDRHNGDKVYGNKRYTFLDKIINKDTGEITYSDTNRFICIDINDRNNHYYSGLVKSVLDKVRPIKLPYYPHNNPIKVYCEDFLCNKENGDFDTVGIFYAVLPDGNQIDIDKFYKSGNSISEPWIEINSKEYAERLHNQINTMSM